MAPRPTPIRSVLQVFALDCPDPPALAAFYAGLLGWRVVEDRPDDEWVNVLPPEHEPQTMKLAFQLVPDHREPTWPEGDVPQQAHLDFHVPSLAGAVPLAEAAGARRHPVQPAEDGSWVVFTDPAGHLFCLCQA